MRYDECYKGTMFNIKLLSLKYIISFQFSLQQAAIQMRLQRDSWLQREWNLISSVSSSTSWFACRQEKGKNVHKHTSQSKLYVFPSCWLLLCVLWRQDSEAGGKGKVSLATQRAWGRGGGEIHVVSPCPMLCLLSHINPFFLITAWYFGVARPVGYLFAACSCQGSSYSCREAAQLPPSLFGRRHFSPFPCLLEMGSDLWSVNRRNRGPSTSSSKFTLLFHSLTSTHYSACLAFLLLNI